MRIQGAYMFAPNDIPSTLIFSAISTNFRISFERLLSCGVSLYNFKIIATFTRILFSKYVLVFDSICIRNLRILRGIRFEGFEY